FDCGGGVRDRRNVQQQSQSCCLSSCRAVSGKALNSHSLFLSPFIFFRSRSRMDPLLLGCSPLDPSSVELLFPRCCVGETMVGLVLMGEVFLGVAFLVERPRRKLLGEPAFFILAVGGGDGWDSSESSKVITDAEKSRTRFG
ncbi:unnamed protein product, partial [Heterosigma akashiwo]